jgi:hypothetical protein
MNNTLSDLNNHLFAQIERLGDESIKGEDLKEEIDRAKAITGVSTQIIANGSLALRAEQFKSEVNSVKDAELPKFLESK